MARQDRQHPYDTRSLVDGYPELDALEAQQVVGRSHHGLAEGRDTVRYIARLLPCPKMPASALVLGCGARPHVIRAFQESGFKCIGVEPVRQIVEEARVFLNDPTLVREGSAERLPVDDESQDVVTLESVLEHVDSPQKALSEIHRVLRPRGIAYITTTNRLALRNDEYHHRFFQWYPPVLKEAYIHHHLHFDPSLGNYTTRPAVHWFTFSDLCSLGRAAGFCRFYSKLDIVTIDDPPIARRLLRRLVFRWCQTIPLLRAVALTQSAGGTIFMVKR